jgi:hypothetical protein
MHVYVLAGAETVLAGRVVETARSALPDTEVTFTTDPSTPSTPAVPAERRRDPDRADPHAASAWVVLAGAGLPASAFDRTGPTLALAFPDASVPERVPRVPVDPERPDPALAAVRDWLRDVTADDHRASTDEDGRDGLGRVAGAAAAGGLAGFLLGGLLGDDVDPFDDGFL